MSFVVDFSDPTPPDSSLLGGKGYGLRKMAQLGLPVPPGFTITTQAWKDYDTNHTLSDQLKADIATAITRLEQASGKKFGDASNPLLVSVRSGSKFSMPGMMSTILNVGITQDMLDKTVSQDTFRRFIKMYASSVFTIHDGAFDHLTESTAVYLDFVASQTGKQVDMHPQLQIEKAIISVFDSWYNPGAISYRNINGISEELGTAVNVQMMVFGNQPNSGTGVLFTRNTITGANELMGDYLENAQGEDIVRGANLRQTLSIAEFVSTYPSLGQELTTYAKKLELENQDVQDIEFTVENGKIWLLQTRTATRSALANIRINQSLFSEQIITKFEALRRIKPGDVRHITSAVFEPTAEQAALKNSLLAAGMAVSPGVATGQIALSIADVQSLSAQSKSPVLFIDHIDPNDVGTLSLLAGVVTTKGSASSHMGLVFRSLRIPAIMGCHALDLTKLQTGQAVSLNGSTGNIYAISLPKTEAQDLPVDVAQLVADREALFGDSAWSAGLYKSAGTPDVEQLTAHVQTAWKQVINTWQSEKSRATEIFNLIFPKQIIIPSVVIKKDDKDAIRKYLLQVISDKFYNSPRTCHHPVKLAGAPWAFGPDTSEAVEDFLTNPNYPGKYGGYPKWLEDETLETVMVTWEEQGKLDPNLATSHFVATMSCLDTTPAEIHININFGTAQLRSLERVEATKLVTVKAKLLDNADYGLGNITYSFGSDYLHPDKVAKVHQQIQANDISSAPLRHLSKILSVMPLEHAASTGNLPHDSYHLVVDDTYWELSQKIAKQIFDQWWRPEVSLPYLMTAIDHTIGMSVVEIQGRFNGTDIVWMKVYGTKGAEEKEKARSWYNKANAQAQKT